MATAKSNNRIQVDASLIPQRKREQLAAPLLRIVAAAFKDPIVQKDFEEWQRKRAAIAQGGGNYDAVN